MGPGTAQPRAVAALLAGGAVLLTTGTALHPLGADPADPVAAFAEYAADAGWLGSHLLQLAGVAASSFGLILLGDLLPAAAARPWARLGAAAAVAGLGVAAVLQAVDGIALKVAVDRLAAAPEAGRALAFEAAMAVRQVEIGLAAMLSLVFGLTALLYGAALLGVPRGGWLGWLAIGGGAGLLASGILVGSSGFSATAMAVNMAASLALVAWLLAAAGWAWARRARP